jgi:hypothetical protein
VLIEHGAEATDDQLLTSAGSKSLPNSELNVRSRPSVYWLMVLKRLTHTFQIEHSLLILEIVVMPHSYDHLEANEPRASGNQVEFGGARVTMTGK